MKTINLNSYALRKTLEGPVTDYRSSYVKYYARNYLV